MGSGKGAGSIIRECDKVVLADKKDDHEVYRRAPVRIMGAKHEPVQPYLIQSKMEQLRNITEHTIPRLARSILNLKAFTRL